MTNDIESLLRKITKILQGHLEKQNLDAVTTLSPLIARLKDLQRRSADIARDVSEIEAALANSNGNQTLERVNELLPPDLDEEPDEVGRQRPQTLRVTIDWQANKRQHPQEQICEHTAAATMAALVARLIQELGDEATKKIEPIRINRGPLISKSPARDFVNQAQGRLYGHKKLRGTDYYILTHSSTTQKVDDIRRLCRVLGLVPGSVQVEQIARENAYI
jgi:hypothetical protein